MITHYVRNVVTTSLICLFLLTLAPVSSGQQPAAGDVPVLIRDLKNKDARIRAEAVRRLTPLGEAAKPAIPALVEALGDSDAKVRYRALIVLGHLWSGLEHGPEIEAAVPLLIKLLKDKDEYTRTRAIFALRMIGPGARAALPALNAIRHDRADPQWIEAFTAVNDIERPATDDVSSLAALLKDKDAKVRTEAAERLASMSMKASILYGYFKGEAAIPALIEALRDPETKVRYHSLSTLGFLMYNPEPPDLASIIPTVTELLKDADSGIRWHAASILGHIGPRSRTAVPMLAELLNDINTTVRNYAADAIGDIGGPDTKAAVPSLIKLLNDPDSTVRESAAVTLSKIDPGSAPVVVAALSEDLKHEKAEFRGRAARSLGYFGAEAKPAVPLLAELVKTEKEYSWRHEVVRALEKIGPAAREATPALRSVLNDSVDYIRLAAAIALLKIDPENKADIAPDLLNEANAKIEKDEAEAQIGIKTHVGIYVPEPGTKWDEAMDLLSRGAKLYKQGKLDEAIESFTAALGIDPQYPDAYSWRGALYRLKGQYAAAIEDYTKAIESDKRSTEAHYLARGWTQMDTRNYDAAIADFTEIIKVNAYNAQAFYSRGVAHHYKGDLDAAIADFDRALQIVPPVTQAFAARAGIRVSQGKFSDALIDYEQAVKAEPNNAYYYEGLGDVYGRLRDTVKASEAWNKALSLSSDTKTKDRLKRKLSSVAAQ